MESKSKRRKTVVMKDEDDSEDLSKDGRETDNLEDRKKKGPNEVVSKASQGKQSKTLSTEGQPNTSFSSLPNEPLQPKKKRRRRKRIVLR